MILVPYYPIADEVMKQIIDLQLGRIGRRLKENHGAKFTYDDNLVAHVASALQGGRERGPATSTTS